MVEKFIIAAGVALRVCEYGSGDKSVLLLHGYLENANVWEDFAKALSKKYRVIAIDLPGHGISEVKGEVHSMELLADVAADVIATQGMGSAVVVGHSMGGYVGAAMLERHPEKVKGLIFFHSSPFADSEQKILDREREIKIIEGGKKELIARMAPPLLFAEQNRRRYANAIEDAYEAIILTEDEGIIAILRGMAARTDRNEVVRASKVPVMLIFGRHDEHIPVEKAAIVIEAQPNAEVVWLEESGHNGFVEQSELSESIVSDFVEKCY